MQHGALQKIKHLLGLPSSPPLPPPLLPLPSKLDVQHCTGRGVGVGHLVCIVGLGYGGNGLWTTGKEPRDDNDMTIRCNLRRHNITIFSASFKKFQTLRSAWLIRFDALLGFLYVTF